MSMDESINFVTTQMPLLWPKRHFKHKTIFKNQNVKSCIKSYTHSLAPALDTILLYRASLYY